MDLCPGSHGILEEAGGRPCLNGNWATLQVAGCKTPGAQASPGRQFHYCAGEFLLFQEERIDWKAGASLGSLEEAVILLESKGVLDE